MKRTWGGLIVLTAVTSLAGCASAPAVAPFEALAVADEALAPGAANTSPPAPPTAAYVHDPERYSQLIVRVSYGEGAGSNAIDRCPDSGFEVPRWRDILSGDRWITAGFTVVTPDGLTVAVEPMTVKTTRHWLGGLKCTTEFHRAEYRSSLYVAQPVEGQRFVVRASAHGRLGATDDTLRLIRSSTQLLMGLSSFTAPMAADIAKGATDNLKGNGESLLSTTGDDIYLDRVAPLPPYTHEVVVGGRRIPVRIEVRLVNHASRFVSGAQFASNPSPPSAAAILGTVLRPGATSATSQSVQDYLNQQANAALRQIDAADTVSRLSDACENLDAALASAGLTATDKALIRWAVISRTNRLASADRDQARCLRENESLLKRAGVILADPPVTRPDSPQTPSMRAATGAEIQAMLGWNGSQDNLIRFFKLDIHHLAADLFAYPLEIVDPDAVLVRAGQTSLGHPDSWRAHAAHPGRPFFTNFGCYSGGGDGVWRAGGRVEGADGPVDYAVALSFRTDGLTPARIHRIELSRDREALSCR